MWLRGAQYLAHLALNTHTFVARCDCSSDDHRVWNNSRYVNQEPGNGSCEGQVVCGCSVGLVVSLLKLSLWYKMTLGSHQLVVMARGPCKTSVVLWNPPVKQKLALWRMRGIICIFCAFIYICDVTSRSKKKSVRDGCDRFSVVPLISRWRDSIKSVHKFEFVQQCACIGSYAPSLSLNCPECCSNYPHQEVFYRHTSSTLTIFCATTGRTALCWLFWKEFSSASS